MITQSGNGFLFETKLELVSLSHCNKFFGKYSVTMRILLILLVVLLPQWVVAMWLEDFTEAEQRAKAEEKHLLIFFTGNDWSKSCQRLKERVLRDDAFVAAAEEKFVLVELDFPRVVLAKGERGDDDQGGNSQLRFLERYEIDAFPTIILADASGRRPFGVEMGAFYPEPLDYWGRLNTAVSNYEKFLELRRDSEQQEGGRAARLLIDGLSKLPLRLVARFYEEELARLRILDPDDRLGYLRKLLNSEQVLNFEKELDEALRNGKFADVIEQIDAAMLSGSFDLSPLQMQGLLFRKAVALSATKQLDKALKVSKEAMRLAPESDLAQALEFMHKLGNRMPDGVRNND